MWDLWVKNSLVEQYIIFLGWKKVFSRPLKTLVESWQQKIVPSNLTPEAKFGKEIVGLLLVSEQ